jgi:hypothetical protein
LTSAGKELTPGATSATTNSSSKGEVVAAADAAAAAVAAARREVVAAVAAAQEATAAAAVTAGKPPSKEEAAATPAASGGAAQQQQQQQQQTLLPQRLTNTPAFQQQAAAAAEVNDLLTKLTDLPGDLAAAVNALVNPSALLNGAVTAGLGPADSLQLGLQTQQAVADATAAAAAVKGLVGHFQEVAEKLEGEKQLVAALREEHLTQVGGWRMGGRGKGGLQGRCGVVGAVRVVWWDSERAGTW